jgi:flagellar hook-associated protein 1
MPGITQALEAAANHITALDRSLSIIQENIGNASTPGYARQDLGAAIDSASDSTVSVQQSSRNEFAETAVRQQNSLFGHFDQLSSGLESVETNFSASGDTGIPNAVNNLFASFSALSANPGDHTARQSVIDQATQLANTFNGTARNLAQIQGDTRQQVSSEVDTINHLAGLVQVYNSQHRTSASSVSDPIVDAKLHETLEQLSEFTNVQALKQNDGSITLLLNGQTPLVVGENQFRIQADVTSGPAAAIRDAFGEDITGQVSGGRLSASLQVVNQSIPGYQDSLNQLAQGIADSVNALLAAGIDANGDAGAALFTYGSSSDAASTLAATVGITAAQVAAATPSAPGGNGNALALSALGTSQALNGFTFAAFYGNISATVGRDVANAKDSRSVQTQLLSQARAQREAVSGVSLDEEAVRLVEFQRAYQATAKVVTILDQLSQDTINMVSAA